jgi:tetratricopeptide (TPR) repeat protein
MFTRALPENGPKEWRGLEMFTHQRLPFSDPRLQQMYNGFRQNLTDIVHTGSRAGADVLLVTVPVNVRDFTPFASADPDNAEAEFRKAQQLLASGRMNEALQGFRRARDYDVLRFRADSRINEIIRETAGNERARLVDAEASFGLAGDDLLWEHVHFTPEGTYRLASMLANELGIRNTPSFDQVKKSLPITSWDERNLRMQIAALLRRPPFTARSGNAERLAELQTSDGAGPEARSAFEAAVAHRPNDLNLLGRYASLLRDLGEPKASAEIFAQMIRLLPGRKAWHASRGAALSDAGMQDAAIAEHNEALAIDPQFDAGHFGLGLARARMGRHHDAIQHYEEALRLNPTYAEAAYNLAGSLAALGRNVEARRYLERAVAEKPEFSRAHAALAQLDTQEGRVEDAIRHYRDAVTGESTLPEAHYDLGVLLARLGRLDEAVAQYRRATELRPRYPEALNNLGIALARQGDSSGAAQAFERALAVQPSFEAARTNLLRIRGTVARR